jgi:hypothetical protein
MACTLQPPQATVRLSVDYYYELPKKLDFVLPQHLILFRLPLKFKPNETHDLLAYGDEDDLLDGNMRTMEIQTR